MNTTTPDYVIKEVHKLLSSFIWKLSSSISVALLWIFTPLIALFCFSIFTLLLCIDEFIDGGKQKVVYDAALDWAIAHLEKPPEAAKPTAKSKEKAGSSPAESMEFENVGQFLKACLDNLGMNKTDVTEALSIAEVSELPSLDEAYKTLVGWKNKSPS